MITPWSLNITYILQTIVSVNLLLQDLSKKKMYVLYPIIETSVMNLMQSNMATQNLYKTNEQERNFCIMIYSSLGFHTMTLDIFLTDSEALKLLSDFTIYSQNEILNMYFKKEGKYVKYYHSERYAPSNVKIYFNGRDRGIQWHIYNDEWHPGMYVIKAKINPKILAGITDYLTAATLSDMNCAIANFNDISKSISPLLHSFNDYGIKRIDYCVNIYLNEFIPEHDPIQIMNLIKRSAIPPHFEEWAKYDETAHRMKSRPESFYLKSKSVVINYYSKYLQLLNKSKENIENGYDAINPEIIDASQGIYRFEVQCKYHKIYSFSQAAQKSGDSNCNKYKSLLNPVKCIEIVSDYYKKTIGKGDWYTLSDAMQIIKSKNFNSQKEKRLLDTLKEVNTRRSLSEAKKLYPPKQLRVFNQGLNELSDLGVNPVTIPREWNIKHIPNLLRAYFDKLAKETYGSDLTSPETNYYILQGYMDYCKKFGHAPI